MKVTTKNILGFFLDRMKRIVTPEELERQLSNNPRTHFEARKFLHLFRKENSVGVVWKQFISASGDELINQAIFIEVDGKVLLDHCMIC